MSSSKSSSPKTAGKEKAIKLAMDQIEKQFGKGAIMKLGEKPKVSVDVIPTGSLSLDIALGIGGVPKGRIIEIYGPEASGKTTLALHIVAEAQKKGGKAAFIDAEHALDPAYAKKIGVDVDELILSQPDYGEQALEILETLVRSGGIEVIVVDSVAALTPRAEIEGDMGDAHMGLQARLMSQALRKITAITAKTGTTVVFLNQIRMKIGVMFGNPETTTGGRALKFYASVRIEIRRKEAIKKGDEVIGQICKVKIVKNKIAPPFKEAFVEMGPEGMSKEIGILDAAIRFEVIEKAGSWFKKDSKNLAQGREGIKALLKEDKKLAQAIEKEVREKVEVK